VVAQKLTRRCPGCRVGNFAVPLVDVSGVTSRRIDRKSADLQTYRPGAGSTSNRVNVTAAFGFPSGARAGPHLKIYLAYFWGGRCRHEIIWIATTFRGGNQACYLQHWPLRVAQWQAWSTAQPELPR